MTEERRQFNRVAFDAVAIFCADKQQIECQIIDLSIHGALVKLLSPDDFDIGSDCQLKIPLGENAVMISMELELMHQKEDRLGLKCVHIDLDSITHLRRLVELNLGDSELLERDFDALISGSDTSSPNIF